jgi:hypothetical protein
MSRSSLLTCAIYAAVAAGGLVLGYQVHSLVHALSGPAPREGDRSADRQSPGAGERGTPKPAGDAAHGGSSALAQRLQEQEGAIKSLQDKLKAAETRNATLAAEVDDANRAIIELASARDKALAEAQGYKEKLLGSSSPPAATASGPSVASAPATGRQGRFRLGKIPPMVFEDSTGWPKATSPEPICEAQPGATFRLLLPVELKGTLRYVQRTPGFAIECRQDDAWVPLGVADVKDGQLRWQWKPVSLTGDREPVVALPGLVKFGRIQVVDDQGKETTSIVFVEPVKTALDLKDTWATTVLPLAYKDCLPVLTTAGATGWTVEPNASGQRLCLVNRNGATVWVSAGTGPIISGTVITASWKAGVSPPILPMTLNELQLQERDANSEISRIERQIRLADPNLSGPASKVRDPYSTLIAMDKNIAQYRRDITYREKLLGIPGMEANVASIESTLPRTAGSLLVKSAVDETRRSDPNYRGLFEKWDAVRQELDKARQDATLVRLRRALVSLEDQRDLLQARNLTPEALAALNDKRDQKLKLLKDLRAQQALVERQLQDARAPCEMIVKAEAANCGTPLAEITLRIAPGGKTGGN